MKPGNGKAASGRLKGRENGGAAVASGSAVAQGASRASGGRERRVAVALSIAGFDPSSGAGVTADLKTFAAHGVYGVACATALTVQSTLGVRAVEPVAAATVRATLECLADDVDLAGVKLGMLARADIVAEVVRFLRSGHGAQIPRDRVVLDPVLRSTSGAELLDPAGVDQMRSELLGLIGWITPNLAELALLTGRAVTGHEDVPEAARALRSIAAGLGNPGLRVVVTGGHLRRPDDFLVADEGEFWLRGEHVATESSHGTGCAFASALLCQRIAGFSPADAVTNAKAYVTVALRSAYPVGKGHGPMHHLFKLG